MEDGMLVQFAEMPQLINSFNTSVPKNTADALDRFYRYEQRVLTLDGLEA